MKKALAVTTLAICATLAGGMLSGCASTSPSSKAIPSSTAASSSQATSDGAERAGTFDDSNALLSVGDVDISDIAIEVVGSTPNLEVTFANATENEADIDCSKFEVKVDDQQPIEFWASTKTIPPMKDYIQYSFTADAGSMQIGDAAYVYYDGTFLGTYEVAEF